jgi:hypothetical protein
MAVHVTDRAIEDVVEMAREMVSWSSGLEDNYIRICVSILSEEPELGTTERGKIYRGGPYPLYVSCGQLVSGEC